jgi:hypothetical protein
MLVNRDRTMGKEEMGKGKGNKTDNLKNNTLLVKETTQLSIFPAQLSINQ